MITPQLADKVSACLEKQELEVVKKWLRSVIDDLDLLSLQTFSAKEIASAFPDLISSIAQYLVSPSDEILARSGIKHTASLLVSIRNEEIPVTKVMDDFNRLRELLVGTLVQGLRGSDREVIGILQRLDAIFHHFSRMGIEFYMQKHSQELRVLADTDPMTGLYNVRYFRKRLHENLEMFSRYQIPFSLIMMDLDNLKELNDSMGHEAGDQALKNLANILLEQKRETDMAFRYGGDEFFLLLPGMESEGAEVNARRIIARIEEIKARRTNWMTTVSAGIVSCPVDGTEVAALRTHVDQALYKAKKAGGDSVVRYKENGQGGHKV